MQVNFKHILLNNTAAVSCSPIGPGLGGVGLVFGLTGKLGRAWVVVQWSVHGIGG